MAGKLDPVDAAAAELVTSELHCETVDKCLQLFGGWGYMWEYPIARAYADARIVKIAGGSVEVMKTNHLARYVQGQDRQAALMKAGLPLALPEVGDSRGSVPSRAVRMQKNLDTNLRFGFLIRTDRGRTRRRRRDHRDLASHFARRMA